MKDKVVVITGASSGIGAELARIVGERGGKPVLAARREDALRDVAATAGPDALVVPTDVTKRDEVARLVRTTLDHFGRIDVWVNNAGRGISMPVSQVTDDDFDTMMLVNTKSALYGMQAVLPHFKERGDGHIINVSSLLGRVPVAHVRSAYNAAKHALNALTGSLRIELQQDYPGIQVSTVSPGVVATEFGVRALGGGMDSRQMPNAQPVTEVAEVIADVIETPRADVYSRPMYKDLIAAYFAADDMAEVERRPPFVPPAAK
ncbi:MAG: SDR family NAD(P)-dependent oxidoreductase [Candidatus Eisenbacteria bacterium]|uniref:SDR family NAD(P)-dependent oxidoreductase n=1 Tax=Eiseniibacteriota bacterium TaxID=2212470 RepID=A0A956ND50_UNCEI|nr:SDR family NAD(P)-dependent oxidoreductase [Candidatus Eisenbacteria bacterium]